MQMFGNKKTGNITFAKFNAQIGKFTILAAEGDEGAVKVTTSAGNTRWERQFETCEGIVVGLQHVVDTDPKDNAKNTVKVRLRSTQGEPDAIITMTVSALCVANFIGALNATDLSKPIRLAGSFFPAGSTSIGKRKLDKPLESDQVFLSVFDEKGYVTPYFGPNGLPKSVEHKIGNKSVWDSSERENFTIKLINDLSVRLQSNAAAPAADSQARSPAASNASALPGGFDGMPDDLPPPEAYSDARATPFSHA